MTKLSPSFNTTLQQVESCTLCQEQLPMGARPVVQMHPKAKILIAGQAPGVKVHQTGIPFNDASGDRLRSWMGLDKTTFYDAQQIAILPMGFCYPGTGQSGDLPPRKECAEQWRTPLLKLLTQCQLTLLIGQYAINWHLKTSKQCTLTETVKNWERYGPQNMPLPHPSPRNNIWLKKNEWFEETVLPELKARVQAILRH